MAFDLNDLSAYTDQLGTDLITKAVLQPISVQHLTVKAGLTAATTALNVLDTVTDVKDYSCGFTDANQGNNAVVFSQIPLTVATKMVKQSLCVNDLRDVWISSQLNPSGYQTETPFAKQITDLEIKKINAYIENTIWSGDGNSLDGLKSQLSVTNGAIDASGLDTAWTVNNAYQNFWDMVQGLFASAAKPVAQMDDLVAYVSYKTYSTLVQSLQAKAYSIIGAYGTIDNATGKPTNSFYFPGTSVKVVAIPGLVDDSGKSAVIIGSQSYVYFGTGLMDDQDKLKLYYDPSQDVVRMLAAFRMGTAAYSSQFISTIA